MGGQEAWLRASLVALRYRICLQMQKHRLAPWSRKVPLCPRAPGPCAPKPVPRKQRRCPGAGPRGRMPARGS